MTRCIGVFFFFFGAAHVAYGSSQARGQRRIQAASATYATACGSDRSILNPLSEAKG